jgi:hypothetical protein
MPEAAVRKYVLSDRSWQIHDIQYQGLRACFGGVFNNSLGRFYTYPSASIGFARRPVLFFPGIIDAA